MFRPAMAIAEDAILESTGLEFVSLPKKSLLKRVANRTRAKLRPSEPTMLDFEVLGEPFKRQRQLMSLHAFIIKDGASQQMPLVFCLMSKKTTRDYKEVFKEILKFSGTVSVEGFVVDYEKAAWLAIREVFPSVEVKGCAFHWSQAVWRKVQNVGLAETYQRRTGTHSIIRQLLSLQFLPAGLIRRTFDVLNTKASTPPMRVLMNYIQDQWLANTVFGVEVWSVYQQTIRTNNDVEGWHHRLNSKTGSSGLHYYKLVPLLRREAELGELAVRVGDLSRNVRAKSTFLDNRLTQLWNQLTAREISTSRLLKMC